MTFEFISKHRFQVQRLTYNRSHASLSCNAVFVCVSRRVSGAVRSENETSFREARCVGSASRAWSSDFLRIKPGTYANVWLSFPCISITQGIQPLHLVCCTCRWILVPKWYPYLHGGMKQVKIRFKIIMMGCTLDDVNDEICKCLFLTGELILSWNV